MIGCRDQNQCQEIDETMCAVFKGLKETCPTICGGPPCKDLPKCKLFNLTPGMCELQPIKHDCPLGCDSMFFIN